MTASRLIRQASFLDMCPITAVVAAMASSDCIDALDLCVPIGYKAVAGKTVQRRGAVLMAGLETSVNAADAEPCVRSL